MNEINKNMYSVNIFNFIDFRDYLEKVITVIRELNKAYTYRKLSALFGFKSPNFLLLLIQKKRNLSLESAEHICRTLKLNKAESEYFVLMVKSTLEKKLEAREIITKKMLRIQKGKQVDKLDPQLYELYEHWYYVILREVLILPNIPHKPNFLAKFFEYNLTEAEIKRGLSQLEKLNLIEKKSGRYLVKSNQIKTGNYFSNTYLLLFHKKMMELAQGSLDKYAGNQRYLSSLTLPLNEKLHAKLRELIEEFKFNSLELSESESEQNQVFQMNIQLFPLTKVYHEEK